MMSASQQSLAESRGARSGASGIAELRDLGSIYPYMAESKPFIFRKGAAGWHALTKWSGQEGTRYLCERHGKAMVDVAVSSGSDFSGDVRKAMSETMSFKEFVDKDFLEADQRANTNFYLAQCPIFCSAPGETPILPDLMQDIAVPPCIEGKLCSANLWMSRSCPTHSTVHYDGHHNLLCVITGSKLLTLYPPDDKNLQDSLRPVHVPSHNHCTSQQSESGSQVTVQAGDCLYIPEGWFHEVDSEPFTIAVNLWWPGLGSFLAESPIQPQGASCCSQVGPSWGSLLGVSWTRGGAGGVRGYYARRLLEGLLEEHKKEMLSHCLLNTDNNAHDVRGKRKRGAFAGGMSIGEQCEALRGMSAEERDQALMALKDAGGGKVEELLSGMDCTTAEVLTSGWEAYTGADEERLQALVQALWGASPDGGESLRNCLMVKKEEFAKQAMESLLLRTLGYNGS